MMRVVLAFLGGIYVGQEYIGIPRIKPIVIKMWDDLGKKLDEYTKNSEDKK